MPINARPETHPLPTSITEAAIHGFIDSQMHKQRHQIRADTRRGHRAVGSQRALIRQHVFDRFEAVGAPLRQVGQGWRADTSNLRNREVPDGRLEDILGGYADALGLREEDGWIHGMERADTYPGENIVVRPGIVDRATQARALIATIPSETIPASTELYEIRTSKLEGSANVHKDGATKFSHVSWRTGTERMTGTTIVTTTTENWEAQVFGFNSSVINSAERDAAAASTVMLDLEEDLTRDGYAATNLQGLRQIECYTAVSKLDYTRKSTVTLGEYYVDVMNLLLDVADANDDRGLPPNVAMVGPRLLRKLLPANNFDAGGSIDGGQLFALIAGAAPGVGQAFEAAGVERVVQVPSLNNFGEDLDTKGQTGMFLFRDPEQFGLMRTNALAPAPLRTFEGPGGTTTVWGSRGFGVSASRATGCARLHFQTR